MSKRDYWSDQAIRQMLSIIKEKHTSQLLACKPKRNKGIFLDIAEDLRKCKIIKTDVQIRNKYKSLKSDFYKAKRNNNSGAKRQTCEHHELLNEIFGHRSALKREKLTEEMEDEDSNYDLSDVEETTQQQSVEVLDDSPQFKANGVDVIEMNAEDVDCIPIVSDGEPTHNTEDENLFIPEKDNQYTKTRSKMRSIKRTKQNNYQKVVETFTKNWKESQQQLLQTMKEQDEKLANLQTQKQEEMLVKSLKAMERILEIDRQETAKMLHGFLNKVQPAQSEYFFGEPSTSNATFVVIPKQSPPS